MPQSFVYLRHCLFSNLFVCLSGDQNREKKAENGEQGEV